jgi:hypothetical protein
LTVPLPDREEPGSTLANTEFAAALGATFTGWDMSLHWAEVWDDRAHVELTSGWQPRLVHSRLTMYGLSWALARGDLLLKAEAAHLRGLRFFARPEQRFARSDVMAGAEYTGLSETWVVVEVVRRHLHDFDPSLAQPPDAAEQDQIEWALRLSRGLLNQRLELSLVTMVFGWSGDGGAITRVEGRYDLSDRLELLAGVVLYRSGERAEMAAVGDNDRLVFELEYRF